MVVQLFFQNFPEQCLWEIRAKYPSCSILSGVHISVFVWTNAECTRRDLPFLIDGSPRHPDYRRIRLTCLLKKMKHFKNQVISAAGALLCVLAFWVVTGLKAADMITLVTFIGVSAGAGIYLGFRVGLHGLTLPVYAIAMAMALGYAQVYPYYSSDVGLILPLLIFGIILAPTAVLSVVLVVIVRGVWRMRNRPNNTSENIP